MDIGATILTVPGEGEDVLIPKIPMIPTALSYKFRTLQFPPKLAFCITVNKSQGQTLASAELHLHEPCFSHGQSNVACSRVSSNKQLYIFNPVGYTTNTIYSSELK